MTCQDCRWFRPDKDPAIPFGECRLAATFRNGGPHYGETRAFASVTDGSQASPAVGLYAYPEFGCNQFKPR